MQTVPAKTIVTRTKDTSWFGASYNMNLYRGCCHGCIYCDSRSGCYQNPDFDTVKCKENALELVRDDLRRKVKTGVVATGAMSDPYNPFEEELLLTRHALELLDAYEFGVAIDTKSDLITRDIDLLQSIQEHSPVLCKITITCAGDQLAARLEPRAPSSARRFEAVQTLAKAGIFTGVLLMPVLPYINDTPENISQLLQQAAGAGAKFVYPSFGVTQRPGQREYFHRELDKLYPGMAARYRSSFGSRYHCPSPRAKALYAHFCQECQRLGLLWEMRAIIHGYTQAYQSGQLRFY